MGISHKLVFGVVAIIVVMVLYLRNHRNKKIDVVLLSTYSIFVLLITIGRRESGLAKQPKLNPFYKYSLVIYRIVNSAITEGLADVWQTLKTNEVIISELVLNILLFVPLGFFLPRVSNLFHKWWSVLITGFLFSFSIELIQMVFQRGCFETVDIMNNTIGAMIGYLLFCKYLRIKSDKIITV